MDNYIVYGITDCPACLRACADLMENDCEYVFVEMDFSPTFRQSIKEKWSWKTFPIIVRRSLKGDNLIGGYAELVNLPPFLDPSPS